ncbi:MAG: Gfo/Idh/MocA family oxidoreductase [Planctomycetes bacterium]|nr:Gfo/Idh/MocA family oxidoreductase [Planctomycetota bacterium]
MPIADWKNARQSWPLPTRPRPVCLIGAGGIVRQAHLPAYRRAGFPVEGICDLQRERAGALARDFGIPRVAADAAALVADAPPDAVFDLALPAGAHLGALELLPDGAAVLLQKPMGEDLDGARAIRDLCRAKGLTAAVNHQLRFAPYCLFARELIEAGAIGELQTLEARVTVATPWHLWDFLHGAPRLELQYHSIHYVDLIRSFLGEPRRVSCMTRKHAGAPELASVRTRAMFDYGDFLSVGFEANHCHTFGPRHQESYLLWEGTRGAIKATMGVNLNYPVGEPDSLEFCLLPSGGGQPEWRPVELAGSWFPDAFAGTMANLQRFAAGEDDALWTRVDDAYRTMAVVEACYRASAEGGTAIPE